MTKRDLVIRISNDTNLIQQDVLTVVQKTLDYVTEALIKGETVELRNFGVFEVKLRKPRVGRNPNDPGKDVQIPARAVVKFKPGKEMREAVLRLTPNRRASVLIGSSPFRYSPTSTMRSSTRDRSFQTVDPPPPSDRNVSAVSLSPI